MNRQLQLFAKTGRLVESRHHSILRPAQALIGNFCDHNTTKQCSKSQSRGIVALAARTSVHNTKSAFGNIANNFSNTRISPVVGGGGVRTFHSEAEYHNAADESLEIIQDTIEETLEDAGIECEVSCASGVLTMSLPPHGTFVINKQTPNQQIWWSSPISGPRRYEYNEETKKWVFSRDGETTLGETLKEEFQQMFDLELDVDV